MKVISDPAKFIRIKDQPFNVAAIILHGGRIVSIGYNDYGRLSYRWKKQNKYSQEQGIHAEIDALRKWKNKKSGATLITIGFSRAGNTLDNTRPCYRCIAAILAVGKISKLKYIKNGVWTTEKININSGKDYTKISKRKKF